MSVLPFRDQVVAPVVWVAAGTCWTVQLLLPWTSEGLLSASSSVDGFRLVRSGVVSSILPGWAAYLLLALPATGLALVALAPVAGAGATTVRLVLAGGGSVVLVLSLHVLVAFDPARLGPGGWVAVVGLGLVVIAAVLDRTTGRRPVQIQEAVPCQ